MTIRKWLIAIIAGLLLQTAIAWALWHLDDYRNPLHVPGQFEGDCLDCLQPAPTESR